MKSFRAKLTTLAGCSAALAALVFTISLAQPSALAQSRAVARSAATMETRSAFATNIEDQLRKRGIDASVQLDGDERDTLRIEFSNMTRRDVFHFVNSTMVRDAAPMIGFKSVAFSNGEQQWDYDLARESMVSHPVQF